MTRINPITGKLEEVPQLSTPGMGGLAVSPSGEYDNVGLNAPIAPTVLPVPPVAEKKPGGDWADYDPSQDRVPPPAPKPESKFKKGLGDLFSQDNYTNKILPALAIIEAIATKGKSPGTTALNTMGMMQKKKVTDEEFRKTSLERMATEGLAAESKTIMESEDDAETKNARLLAAYQKYMPAEYSKLKMQEGVQTRGSTGGQVGWKIEQLMKNDPSLTFDQAYRMATVPSTQFGPSDEKLWGVTETSEAQVLGKTSPEATEATINAQNLIEEATRTGKLRTAADLKSLLDQIELGTGEQQRAQILEEETKKKAGSVSAITSSAEALLNTQPDMIGGGVSGLLTRGVAAGGQALTGEASAAKAHDQLMEANVSLAAKRIAEQAGSLSDQDMERAKKLLPFSSDPKAVFESKLVFLKTIEDPTVDVATKKAAFDGLYTKLYSGSASPAPAQGADKYIVGKQYKDAQGNMATYLGNGKWQE